MWNHLPEVPPVYFQLSLLGEFVFFHASGICTFIFPRMQPYLKAIQLMIICETEVCSCVFGVNILLLICFTFWFWSCWDVGTQQKETNSFSQTVTRPQANQTFGIWKGKKKEMALRYWLLAFLLCLLWFLTGTHS